MQFQHYAISDGGMINECRTICGMTLGKGNQSTWRKHHPMPLCPPQISHDLMQDWTWAAAVGSWWLTAWAMAQPLEAGKTAILCILVHLGTAIHSWWGRQQWIVIQYTVGHYFHYFLFLWCTHTQPQFTVHQWMFICETVCMCSAKYKYKRHVFTILHR